VAMGVAMMVVVGVPVGVAMVVEMEVSHRKMLYYNITGVYRVPSMEPKGGDGLRGVRRE
jgi:hypothetical protein